MNKNLNDKLHHIMQRHKHSPSNLQQNLPSISLNQLESKVNLLKKRNRQKQNLVEQVTNNHKEINVCSPFYDRMKTHKQNCKCPYHRKQRNSLVPVHRTNKPPASQANQFQRNTTCQKDDSAFRRHSNESSFFKKPAGHMNKLIKQDQLPFSHTQPVQRRHKMNFLDYSYDQFMKDCDSFILNRKGLALSNSKHVVRKGVKEIFEFIHKHLDYSVQKMSAWIGSIEKDKDYGDFYVERFKQMKINFQINRHKRLNKTTSSSNFGHLLNRTHKLNSDNIQFSHSTTSFSKLQPTRYKKSTRKSLSSNQSSEQSYESSQPNSSDCDSNESQNNLEKILAQIQLKNKLSEKTFQKIMKKNLQSFKELFENLQENILNQHYSNDLLQKLIDQVLQQLLQKYSDSNSIKNLQPKLDIITNILGTIKKYQTRKSSSNLNNLDQTLSNSKGLNGSKRNTQTTESNKTTNSNHRRSKKYSNQYSMKGSSTDLKDRNNKFRSIKEHGVDLDSDGIHGHNNDKNINHGKVRRSKLKGDQFDPNDIRNSNKSISDCSDRFFDRQRHNAHKGFFTRAEKFLFDINMGKAIVNKEDSIFTMKRKIRVVKVLLKQNQNSAQSNQLKDYIKAIQHRIFLKIESNKKSETKMSSTQLLSDEQIWKLISLDNLGFNLIFYNLSSKINIEENDDLCILLNEIKINGIKKFQNHVTYKNHLKAQQDEQKTKTNLKKTKLEDIFVQQGMGNMHFEPKIESESLKDFQVTQRTLKTMKTRQQNLNDLTKLLKSAQSSGPYDFNFDLNEMDDFDMQLNYQKIKKMLKYARMNLPETFEKYLKNTSIYTASQMNSFIDS